MLYLYLVLQFLFCKSISGLNMATMQAIAYIKHFALQKETEKVKIS